MRRRMKQRMNNASRQFFIMLWELQLYKSQLHYAVHVSYSQNIHWVEMIRGWHPLDTANISLPQNPKRSVGRPRARWDDTITSFNGASLDDSLYWIDALYDHAQHDLVQLTDAF